MSRQQLDLSKLGQFNAKAGAGDGAGANTGQLATNKRKSDDADQHNSGATPEAGFPSREPVDEAQLNIKLSHAEAARFRQLAKADRYTLGAFLTLLMDGYEGRG